MIRNFTCCFIRRYVASSGLLFTIFAAIPENYLSFGKDVT